MLRGTKNGIFSLLSCFFRRICPPFHLSSPLSSSPIANFATQRANSVTIKSPTSLTTQTPESISNAVSASSLVTSICDLISSNRIERKDFDNVLMKYKDGLSSSLVLEILMNYRQLGRAKTLEFFSWAGVQMGFRFDDCVVEYMADFLGRRKLFDDMKCLLVTVLLNNGCVSCRAISICIRYLGREGRFREALCLFQEMENKFSCKPDNFVYNNMLYVLCKKGTSGELIDVALEIFRKIELPDTYSYSNVLVGLCKFGRFETAVEVFGEMGSSGLVPTRSAVNVLIGGLCLLSSREGVVEKVKVKNDRRPFTILVPNVGGSKSGDAIQPAIGVFWSVYDLGLLPSSFIINRLISELCQMGKMGEAIGILKVAEEKKLSCVEEGYSIVIKGLCEHRWVDEASHLFGRMLSQGLRPKLAVYNSIVCMLCKLRRINDAERVFEVMNKKRCLPDGRTYAALIHAYGESKNWEAAYELLIEMLGLGLIPHFHTCSLVDRLLREHGRTDLSIRLEGKFESQILLKHCKAGQLETAYEKLRSMLKRGSHPAIYVRDAFENAFHKHGKLKMAQELLEKMDKVCQLDKPESRSS